MHSRQRFGGDETAAELVGSHDVIQFHEHYEPVMANQKMND